MCGSKTVERCTHGRVRGSLTVEKRVRSGELRNVLSTPDLPLIELSRAIMAGRRHCTVGVRDSGPASPWHHRLDGGSVPASNWPTDHYHFCCQC